VETRSEKHDREAKEEYIKNAEEILHFCLHNGLKKKQAFMVTQLSSKLSMDMKQFLWFFEESKNDTKLLIQILENRWEKVERNRIGGNFQL
jgi:hypothetical protein